MFKIDKSRMRMAAVLMIIFLIFTLGVMLIDKQPIGPENSSVGFASINGPVAKMFPYSETWYVISALMGYVALFFAAGFAFAGLRQLLEAGNNRRLLDNSYFGLGMFYVVVMLFYVLFNFVAINYRPVIIPSEGVLELSYPSSHTILGICVMGSSMIQFNKIFAKEDSKRKISMAVCAVLMIAIVVTRLLSGAHWLTDIIGSIILSAALVCAFSAVSAEDGAKLKRNLRK